MITPVTNFRLPEKTIAKLDKLALKQAKGKKPNKTKVIIELVEKA